MNGSDQFGARCWSVDAQGDGGGEVAADPPPQRGGAVVVGEVAFSEGRAQQCRGVEAGAGDRGEPVSQLRGVGVAAECRGERRRGVATILRGPATGSW